MNQNLHNSFFDKGDSSAAYCQFKELLHSDRIGDVGAITKSAKIKSINER